jgi:hypothetical protein
MHANPLTTRRPCAGEPARLSVTVALVVAAIGLGDLAWSQGSASWKLGSSEETVSWTSGFDKDLSQWKTVDCHAEFGERFALTGLIGYKEPSLNLDSFIARLRATCMDLDRTSTRAEQVFTSKNHRDTPYELDSLDWQGHKEFVCSGDFTDGPMNTTGLVGEMEIGTNPGNDYVQNFRFFLRCPRVWSEDYVTWQSVGHSNQMIDDSNYTMFDRKRLSCPADDYVVTGIQLRFEVGKGKIRDLRLLCRKLIYAPG